MKAIIWPVYIDSKKTKHEGRKIPIEDAVSSPKLREISRAAEKLGLNPEVEKNKSYSRSWWELSGRVAVDKNQSKREILIKISKMIKGTRDK
jgi:signal recognition particle subunit SRP19